jgi:hypothetical protein
MQTKERYRVQRGLPVLEVLGQDLAFGLRQLLRSPGYSAVCLLTICLGIGVNAVVFSVIQARGFYTRWQAIGRLKEHISQREAQAELNTIFSRLERAARSLPRP